MNLKEAHSIGGTIFAAGAEIDMKALTPKQVSDLHALGRAGLVDGYNPESDKVTKDDSKASSTADDSGDGADSKGKGRHHR